MIWAWVGVAALADTLTQEQLGKHLLTVHEQAGVPLVVGAAGPIAQRTVGAAAAAHPDLRVYVRLVPVDADPSDVMPLLIEEAGLPCAVWVGASGPRWSVQTHGACGAADGAAPPVTRLQPKIPRLGDTDPAAALRSYQTQCLQRVGHRASWRVLDGRGTQLDALSFTERIGDVRVAEALRQQRQGHRRNAALIGGAGVGLTAFGAGLSRAPRQGIGAGLLSGGALALVFGVDQLRRAVRVGRTPHRYPPPIADELIDDHNAALRVDLGLSGAQTQAIDLR